VGNPAEETCCPSGRKNHTGCGAGAQAKMFRKTRLRALSYFTLPDVRGACQGNARHEGTRPVIGVGANSGNARRPLPSGFGPARLPRIATAAGCNRIHRAGSSQSKAVNIDTASKTSTGHK
jgi:hypothetical protein